MKEEILLSSRPRKKNILYNERNRMFPVMWET